jgi:Ca2+/Na+ antiporter
MVSSYPRTQISIGSPIGAVLIKVTFVFGISPMSRKRTRSAPSPPTALIVAVCPIFSSSSVISVSFPGKTPHPCGVFEAFTVKLL